jgi:hypothetical protein
VDTKRTHLSLCASSQYDNRAYRASRAQAPFQDGMGKKMSYRPVGFGGVYSYLVFGKIFILLYLTGSILLLGDYYALLRGFNYN